MKNELVTIEEREWIAKEAFKEMGKIVKYKVIDLDKVSARLRRERVAKGLSPYVQIQPISLDPYKNVSRLATFQKDPLTGVLYGIAVDQDDYGNIKWQKIQHHDNMSLDLSKESDIRIWSVIRFYPLIKGSPFQDDNPYYKIYDPVDEARREEKEAEMMMMAFNRVDLLESKPREMVNFARYLGEEMMESSNYSIIRGKLLRIAKTNPVEFNAKWDMKNRMYAEILYSALATGVISQHAERGYVFKSIPLGYSEEEVIVYLMKDTNISGSIASEIKEKDKLVMNVAGSMPKKEEKKPEEKKEKVADLD